MSGPDSANSYKLTNDTISPRPNDSGYTSSAYSADLATKAGL